MNNSTQETKQMQPILEEDILVAEAEAQITKSLALLNSQVNLEGSAYYSKALTRKRVIRSAEDLLKMVMVYALTDLSCRMVGLWATVMDWGSLSKTGVRKRLQNCQCWIGMLIVQVLLAGKLELPQTKGLNLRLFDASSVSQPGSHATDWRLHLGFNFSSGRMMDIALTDGKQGESLTRWSFAPNEICLADRYYGNLRGLGVLLGAAAAFIIRIGWRNLPVQNREGQPFPLADWLKVQSADPAVPPAQVQVWVATPQGRFPVRVIARAIPPEKAARNRERLRAEAKRKKTKQDERTLLAAGFVMVVTNLPETWLSTQVLNLYRFRWQIELVFKRLKSVLNFDHLRASDPELAQVYLLTKLLIALLITETQWRLVFMAPDAFSDPERPLSLWRFTQLTLEAFRTSVCGSLTWERIVAHLPQLKRYLCDDPRHRKSQLAALLDLQWVYGC